MRLRDENKEDINKVVQAVLSHSKISSKNNLILAILEEYRPNKPGNGPIVKFFRPILKKLTELDSRPSTKVALKAREVLIQCALPSLEERATQMEHILRSSVVESRYGETGWEHRTPLLDTLKEVIDSKYTVFDVLPTFFAHADPWVSLAALKSMFVGLTGPTSCTSSTTTIWTLSLRFWLPGTFSSERLALPSME